MSALPPTPALAPPPTSPRKRSPLKPIIITIVGGIVLAAGSCVAFLSTLNMNGASDPINPFFALGFFVGVAMLLAGSVWALVALVLFLFRAGKET